MKFIKMDDVKRLDENTIRVNTKLVIKRNGVYTLKRAFDYMSPKEWDSLKSFLINEKKREVATASAAVSKLLAELGIQRLN